MDKNKVNQLLKEFAYWYESITGDDLSSYDQDTTPYEVWEFLTHCEDHHLTIDAADGSIAGDEETFNNGADGSLPRR